MRLSERLKNSLLEAVYASFGDVEVYLFGSRTDDTKKGGDIDIAIYTEMTREHFRKHKIAFTTFLTKMGLDLKIDVVQYHDAMDLVLKNEILNKRIKLAKRRDLNDQQVATQ